jgi:hypothetical protein
VGEESFNRPEHIASSFNRPEGGLAGKGTPKTGGSAKGVPKTGRRAKGAAHWSAGVMNTREEFLLAFQQEVSRL